MEIQKIKQFLANNTHQFEVLGRYEPGKKINIHIFNTGLTFEKENNKLGQSHEYKGVLTNAKGVINAIRRIKDNATIFLGEYSSFTGEEEGKTIISFSEDLIHCQIFSFEKSKIEDIEVNSIAVNGSFEAITSQLIVFKSSEILNCI